MICVPVGDSVGGTDALGIEALRTKIISAKKTLNGLETDYDLNTYFKSLNNASDILFIKKRADIIERRYTAYMIPRTDDGFIVPTNTVTLNFDVADFDAFYASTNRYIIKANSSFHLKPGSQSIIVKNTEVLNTTSIDAMENDITQLLYGTPYLIVINTSPESVSYFLNSVSQKCVVKPDFINNLTANQFVINFVSISRDAVAGDNDYIITVNAMPNGDISDIVTNGAIVDATKFVIFGTVYDAGGVIGYFPMTMDSYDSADNYFIFTGKLVTDDYLSMDNKLNIVNSLIAPNTTALATMLVPGIDLKIGICTYRKEDVDNGRSTYDTIIPGMAGYTLTNVYTNATDLTNFFIDMTNVIRSTATYLDTATLEILEVPVIRYSYLQSHAAKVTEIIQATKIQLDAIVILVTNNFTVDYKFYRTYGASSYFVVDGSVKLDRLNLSMELNLYLFTNALQTFNSNMLDTIKLYIKTFVEKLNLSTGQDSLFISNF